MRAKKTKAGSWRCQVFSHFDDNGKMVRKSFTVNDPSPAGRRKCEALAAEWARIRPGSKPRLDLTFKEAAEKYIIAREMVLSPRTVGGYRAMLSRYYSRYLKMDVHDINSDHAQALINKLAADHSAKTVRNVYGFFASVLREYAPDTILRVKLPEKRPPARTVPSEAQAAEILKAVQGTALELPVWLAIYGPMRRGEICALRAENIDGAIVHVCENMVKKIVDHKGEWVIKNTKSAAGDRFITFPDFVANKWAGKKSGRLISMNPDTLSNEFHRLLIRRGLPVIRFHDLRHYSASILHALGVPDAYIMQRGGWGNDRTLKDVYRHTVSGAQKEMNDKINNYFTFSSLSN